MSTFAIIALNFFIIACIFLGLAKKTKIRPFLPVGLVFMLSALINFGFYLAV